MGNCCATGEEVEEEDAVEDEGEIDEEDDELWSEVGEGKERERE